MPLRIRFGNSWESFDHAPADGIQALAGMGLSFIRVWIFWDAANPQPDVYDWSKVDADIQAIRSAGLEVYANLMWAPAHAANQQPTYLPYTRGCSAWNDPRDGSKGIRFADEQPFCTAPPQIDPQAVHKFGVELATRHGNDITWYAAWNEPGQDLYWPAKRIVPWDVAVGRLLDEVTIPFTDGVRSVQPGAKFVGPEADHEVVIQETLKQESSRGLNLFDRITFHPYSWGPFPENSYKRIDQGFVPSANEHRNGRPLWYSEVGDDGTGKIVEWATEVVKRDVSAINFHDFRQWFEPGTWDNRTYVPNSRYNDMKALIRRVNGKRRIVHSLAAAAALAPASEARLPIRRHSRARKPPKPTKAVARLHDWRLGVLYGPYGEP